MNAVISAKHLAVSRIAVERWSSGASHSALDDVAGEVPVALEYNGISHTVMLASPTDLEDFAIGFSLSEGIVDQPGEIYDLDLLEGEDGIEVRMQIATQRFAQLKERRRSMAGRTGCGLCGAENLRQVFRSVPAVTAPVRLQAEALHAAFRELAAEQRLQRITGATHAAAWVERDGTLACVREDVGRHNALDKLIGALARRRTDFGSGAAIVTSRASYEMVQKAASVGIGVLAAISAPTSLAIRMAEELNVTLAGFVRQTGHAVYSRAERLVG